MSLLPVASTVLAMFATDLPAQKIVQADEHIRWSSFVAETANRGPAETFPLIDWEGLRNPVLASPVGALKNQAVIYWQGWIWFFTGINTEHGMSCVRTRDLKTYVCFTPNHMPGLAPRLVHRDGLWHALYQLDVPDARQRIFYSSTEDLRSWSRPVEAWPSCQTGTRHIDAAIAYESGHYYAGFKSNQKFHVTRSKSNELDLQWEAPVLAEAEGWCEAYQFIKIDGVWRMIATGRAPEGYDTGGNDYTGSHEPFLYTMQGDGTELAHWAHWAERRHIALSFSDWNKVMHANSGYLCDWRDHDGWFYLFFAGANDDTTYRGRGHCKVGVARSRDLVKWYLPGEMER